MFAHPVPRSWVRRARMRAVLFHGRLTWAFVGLVAVADGPAVATATATAFMVGLALVVLLVVLRGPSPTEAAVGEALRTGRLPDGLSLALVDTRAASLVRGARWARYALHLAVVLVVASAVVVAVRGVEVDRVARGVVIGLIALCWGWSTTVTVREAQRWRAHDAERWAARAAAHRSAEA